MGVVIQTDKIQCSFCFGYVVEKHPSVLYPAAPCAVPKPLEEASKRPIQRAPAVLRVKERDVLGHAKLKFRVLGFEGAVNRTVSEQQVPHHPQCRRNGAASRWKHPEGVAHGGEDRGFVDGDPRLDAVGQSVDHPLAISDKRWDVGAVGKAALGFPPVGMGEVVQGHHRTNAAPQEVVHHVRIHGQRSFIPRTFGGLQAAPFNGEPVGRHAEVGKQLEVILPSVPVVARRSTRLKTLGSLVNGPVVHLMAFHLMRSGGRAPVKPFGKVEVVEIDRRPILVRFRIFSAPVGDEGDLEHDERGQGSEEVAFPHQSQVQGRCLCSSVFIPKASNRYEGGHHLQSEAMSGRSVETAKFFSALA